MGREKIFCIGRNKTGTTSLKYVFDQHGFATGSQSEAELLIDHYAKRNFKRIAQYCEKAQIFQDVPFSLPFTYIYLDNHFPNAKFILSVRATPLVWYESLVKFHSKIFDCEGNLPIKEDLQNAKYRYKGYAWKVNRILYNSPEDDIYNQQQLIRSYNIYNQQVKEYFRHKNNLLTVNLTRPNSYRRLCKFIGVSEILGGMPHLKKTV